MSQWDRKALLGLVDKAEKSLHDPKHSVAQRQALQALLAHYGNKAKSVHASSFDVLSMEHQLTQLLGPGDGSAQTPGPRA